MSPMPATDLPDAANLSVGPRHYSDSVTLRGLGPAPRVFARAELEQMAGVVADALSIACYSGRHIREVGHARGVPLTALLEASGLGALPRSQCKQMVLAVGARDAYTCLFTWHELYNTPGGQGALLLVEQDGVAFPASAGGLQLISLGDLRLGPRQAMAVDRLDVCRWPAPVRDAG